MTDPMDDLRQASTDVSGVKVLSPAAQAVLQAVHQAIAEQLFALSGVPDYRQAAAAALRAAADQVAIKLAGLGQESAWYLEEIATELEAQ